MTDQQIVADAKQERAEGKDVAIIDTPSPSGQPDLRQATVVTVSALSSGSGTGGVLVQGGHPIVIKVLQPFTIIAVRAFRVFLQTLLASITATVTGAIPAEDFTHKLVACASISVGAAVISALQNMVELLGKWDQAHPTLTA